MNEEKLDSIIEWMAYCTLLGRKKNVNYSVITIYDGKNEKFINYLLSYRTVVAGIDGANRVIYLFPRHDYSNTTMKHVNKFFKDYVGFTFPVNKRRDCLKKIKNGEVPVYKEYTVKYHKLLAV